MNLLASFTVSNYCLFSLQSLPPTVWNSVCIATWWPLHSHHCNRARCAACSPAVQSAAAVCEKVGADVDQKCLQLVKMIL